MNVNKSAHHRPLLTVLLLAVVQGACCCIAAGTPARAAELDGAVAFGQIMPELLPYAYGGNERLSYDVSYTGGLKIGEIHMAVTKIKDQPDHFVIRSRATTDNGLFSFLYPINDLHVTKVSGAHRLPYHYEVWTEEGYNYRAHREYQFDQRNKRVYYRKNDGPIETYDLTDTTQNEFSAFLASRVMPFTVGQPFLVATFADKKRNEVLVTVKGVEYLEDTLFGGVETIVIEPIMKFTGIYDKRGDTVIWYTNDLCRIPVKVHAKIAIGSLTARLVAYSNPSCQQDNDVVEAR